jgi:antitoxin CptB
MKSNITPTVLDRGVIIKKAIDRALTQAEAAAALGLSERQVRRLVSSFRKEALIRHGQTYWRCRRGVLELDVIFQPFFLKHFSSLTPDEQTCFRALLEEQDPLLQQWLIYNAPCPEIYAALIAKIRG